MNYYVTVASPEQGMAMLTVVVSADSEPAARVRAREFYTHHLAVKTGRAHAELTVHVSDPVPAPPNAYAVMLHPDRTVELVLGYRVIPARFRHPDLQEEIEPIDVLSVHMDEVPNNPHFLPRPFTTQYAGEARLADTPVVTVSEKVIGSLVRNMRQAS